MNKITLLILSILLAFYALSADVFHSTTEGGSWYDPDIWLPYGVPGVEDDVFIHGMVYVSSNECNNLYLPSVSSQVMPAPGAHGALTVNGDLTCNGWIQNNNQYNLTLNLYGNLNITNEFRPHTFNWLGSGNRTLSCADNYRGIKSTYTTSISATIETIFAASDIYFAPGGSSAQYITGNNHKVVFQLFDDETRTAYNLYSRSCKLDHISVLGNGSNSFNFNNDSGLNDVSMQNCHLENLITTGTHYFAMGNTIKDIYNTGMLTNTGQQSQTLSLYGSMNNSGTIQSSGSFVLHLHAYGSIANTGTFNPYTIQFRGAEDRTFSCSPDHPIQAAGGITTEAGLGVIYINGQAWFAAVSYFSGPIVFRVYNLENQAATLGFNNLTIANASIYGISGSILNGNPMTLVTCYLEGLRLEGTIRCNNTCTASIVTNYATLSNHSTSSGSISIQGDFTNHGSILNAYGYSFTMNMYGDIRNYGTWSAYKLDLKGSTAQNLSFGPDHPFTGLLMETTSNTHVTNVIEYDLCFVSSQINMANSFLNLGDAFALRLDNSQLINLKLVSSLDNLLYMIGNSTLNNVQIPSITTSGTVIIASEITFSGSLVNNGTIQNSSGASRILRVGGDVTNNGILQNAGGYSLSVYVAGNLINNGEWKNSYTYLNGQADQLIHFPETHPFMGANFQDDVASSAILTDCDLYFTGTTPTTNIITSLVTWQLASGNYSLYLENCNMYNANFNTTTDCIFSNVGTGIISGCSFQSITFQGTIALSSAISINGDLRNYATLQNSSGSSRDLSVSGSITNFSTIQNIGGFTLTIYVSANVTNLGTWSAGTLILNGSNAQQVSFPATYPFAGKILTDSNGTSPVYFSSDFFSTNGATINTNSANWYLTPGDYNMNLTGGIMYNARIFSNAASTITTSDNCILHGCQFQSLTFTGHIILQSSATVTGNLVNTSTLRNSDSSMSFYINGNLDNQAQIQNSPTGYSLSIYCGGNITNSGTMVNRYLYLNGSGDSAQHIANTGTFDPKYINDSVNTSPVALDTDLTLNACSMDLNNSTLILNDGTRTGKTLNLAGGYLMDTSILGGNGAKLSLSSGAYLSYVTSDELIWDGTVLIYSNVSVGLLVNLGTTMNYPGTSQTLIVQDHLENHGSISNNSSSNLYLNLAGNLFNYGIITNSYIDFNGAVEQTIFQGSTASDIACGSLKKTNSSGSLKLLSDLNLVGCSVSLNNRTLYLNSQRLSLNGQYIANAQLASSETSTLLLSNYAYLNGISGGNLSLQGTVLIYGTCSFTSLENWGVLANRGGGSAILNIANNLTNHNSINNDDYTLHVYVGGNLINRGTISNRRMYINGTGAQDVELVGTESLQQLTLSSGIGYAAWYRNGEYYSSATDLNLNMDFQNLYAEWQPYVAASNTWGRIISIHPPTSLAAPANLCIQLGEDGILLIWDEVLGATCYNIYSSQDPTTGFDSLISGYVDLNPGDGTVQCVLSISTDRAFYIVRADN